jgi:hypothetical protein
MLDLSVFKTVLEAVPSLQQVIMPANLDVQGVDSAQLLVSLMEPAVSNQVYPLVISQDVGLAIAYQQAFSNRQEIDGYTLTRTDGFVVKIISEEEGSFASVAAASDTLRNTFVNYTSTGQAGSIEITDQADDYDETTGRFQRLLEVEVTHLAQPSQGLPAAFIYTIDEQARENPVMGGGVSQHLTTSFAVTLVMNMPATGVSGIKSVRDDVYQALAGQASNSGPVELVGGDIVNVIGGVIVWRDVFKAQQYISN